MGGGRVNDLWEAVPYACGIVAFVAVVFGAVLFGRLNDDKSRCPYCDAPYGSRHYNGCKWGGLGLHRKVKPRPPGS